jgi:RimJ/RimL family protein N-acetyltransferase
MSAVAAQTEFNPLDVQLRDGRHVTLRAIRADDKDRLQEAMRALSTQSSYYRFFSPLRELSPQLLERATRPETDRELQLVAVAGEGAQEKIVGGARYAAAAGTSDCEFAVAIVDEWHGLGLARQLLETLMRTAHARGFQRMEGYILATNTRMLGLAKRLGIAEMESSEGPTVRMVRRDLRTVS